jgi:hypothetical protein
MTTVQGAHIDLPGQALDAQIDARRKALSPAPVPAGSTPTTGPSAKPAPVWGLALSGGGIRSAVFCLGVVVALARNRVLLRFDLMSTVSGGSFIGGLIGRLFDRERAPGGAGRVQDALADADQRWFAWWLRANGHYLFARGAREGFIAAAVMLRNLVALHVELALLALAAGAALALADIGVWWMIDRLWSPGADSALSNTQTLINNLPIWLPTLWLALAVPAALAVVFAAAFWALPRGHGRGWRLTLHAAVWLGAGWAIGHSHGLLMLHQVPAWLWDLVLVFCALWVVAVGVAASVALHVGIAIEQGRALLTKALALTLAAAVMIGLAGVVDRVAWLLAFEWRQSVEVGVLLLLLAGLFRTVLSQLGASSGAAPAWLSGRLLTLGHITGLLVSFCLAAWWISLVYRLVFAITSTDLALRFSEAWPRALTLGGGACFFLLVTGFDVGFVNKSSLHRFFKARLVRGWLAAANANRFHADPLSPRSTEPIGGYPIGDRRDYDANDDTAFSAYSPQTGGGPIHLINLCLNQTTRHGGGPFNRDRKGLCMTVASGAGLRVAEQSWTPIPDRDAHTLGTWIAVSAAAIAPGLGAFTRSGVSALAMFAGVRLGYWWDARGVGARSARRRSPGCFAKSRQLLQETMGRFEGCDAPIWFLSDGGHFDNSGAYALLREHTHLIVLTDCGADPLYRFGDLENLIRKARIDLGADIDFLRPDPNRPDPDFRAFGALRDLAAADSDACIALARIRYREQPDGWLVLVKPNVFNGLPVDLMTFKAANPDFPQQSNNKQSFDEAQWESHFLLGQALGGALTTTLLQRISDASDDDTLPFIDDLGRQRGPTAIDSAKASRAPARLVAAGAVTASIGLGAAATAGVSVWQVIDAWRVDQAKTANEDDKALKDLAALWGKYRPVAAALPSTAQVASAGAASASSASRAEAARATASASAVKATPAPDVSTTLGELAATLLRVGDTLCDGGFDKRFAKGKPAQRILSDARDGCLNQDPRMPACELLLSTTSQEESCLFLPGGSASSQAAVCPVRYWGRDYRRELADVDGNCRRANTAPPTREPPTPPPPSQPVQAVIPTAALPAPVPASPMTPALPSPKVKPAPQALAVAPGPCGSTRVWIQVYGTARRQDAADLIAWIGPVDLTPRIEDMNATAERYQRPQPRAVSADVVRWHHFEDREDDKGCAEAIVNWLAVRAPTAGALPPHAEPLARYLKSARKTVEVWLAPGLQDKDR